MQVLITVLGSRQTNRGRRYWYEHKDRAGYGSHNNRKWPSKNRQSVVRTTRPYTFVQGACTLEHLPKLHSIAKAPPDPIFRNSPIFLRPFALLKHHEIRYRRLLPCYPVPFGSHRREFIGCHGGRRVQHAQRRRPPHGRRPRMDGPKRRQHCSLLRPSLRGRWCRCEHHRR